MNDECGKLNLGNTFVVLDIETTGFYFEYWDEPIEVCAILIKDQKIESIFHKYIKPYKKIPKEVEELTKITNEQLDKELNRYKILPELRDFIGDNIVVAHNAKFDVDFLNFWFLNLKLPVIKRNICTMKAFRKITKRTKNSTLTDACEYFDIDLSDAHSAIADTKATAKLFIEELKHDDVFILEESTEEEVFLRIKKRLYKSSPYRKIKEDLCGYKVEIGRRKNIDKLEDRLSVIDMFKKSYRIEEISSILNIEELYIRELFLEWVNNININNYKYLKGSDQTLKEVKEMFSYCKNYNDLIEMHKKLFKDEPNLFRYQLIYKLELSKKEEISYSVDDFISFFESGKTLDFIEEQMDIKKIKIIDSFVEWLIQDDENRELYRDYIRDNILRRKELNSLVDLGYSKFKEDNTFIPAFKVMLTQKLYESNFFKI